MSYEAPANGWRTFLIVWMTQSVSVFGSALTLFATTIWLTQVLYPAPEQKQALAAAISLTGLAFAIPTVFGAPIAGAWADRHDRKQTMIVADFISGLLSVVLVYLIAANLLNLWLLVGLIFLFASVGAFHGSAFDTSYAMIVPEQQLPRANGMMQSIWSLSGILSPLIAANIIALPELARRGGVTGGAGQWLSALPNGTALAIGIDALTFFVASATLLFLFIPSPKRSDLAAGGGKPRKSMRADIAEGALYIWHRRPLLWLLGTFAVVNLLAGPLAVLQPLLVKFTLAPDWTARGMFYESALALLSSAAGLGGLAGGVFISAWGGLKAKRVYGVLAPMVVGSLFMIAYGLSSGIYMTAVAAFFTSGMIPILNAHSQTIWQTQTPRELQGRVFAVRRVIAQFTWPLSTALAGVVGGLFDPGVVIAVLGAVMLVFCVGQFFNRSLLRVEDKEWLDNMAAAKLGAAQEQPGK